MCPVGRLAALVALGVSLALPGCNEGPAEEALAEAEKVLESTRADLEVLAPEDLGRLEAELAGAREALAEGRYTDALRAAQGLPPRIRAATDRALARRRGLEWAWEDLARTVADRFACLRVRLREAASAPSSEAWLADRRAGLRSLEARWTEAVDAFERGRISRAIEAARAVDAGGAELSKDLGGSPGC